MKKKYFIIILLLSSLYNYGQSITSFTPTNACTGSATTVIIAGTNLTGTTLVDFNGIAATTFTINSDTQITAVLPSGATTGKITITTSSGNGTSVDDFTVNPILVPAVSIAANTGSTICAGTSVTFTATPTNGGSAPLYQWKLNGVNVGGNTSTSTYISSTFVNTDKVTVVLSSSATCTSLATVTSNQITMTVNDILVPSVSISASTTIICPGNLIKFSATATNGGTTPFYQWMINGTNTSTNSPNFSTSLLVDGDVVSVLLTSNATCAAPITATSNSIPITVKPATPATPGIITGTVTQCPAFANSIYSIAAVSNATTYTWTVPIGWNITSGAGTNSITVTTGNAGQNGNISVTAGNSCGTSTASNLAVTINPATPATPGAIMGTVTQCPALNGQIYSIAAVINATSYTWTVPSGWSINAGAGTNSITVTSGNTGENGNISVTAENSCGTSTVRTLAVTVNPTTPATPGVITGTGTQCPALAGQIYSVAAVTNATTYTWTLPTGWSISAGTGTNSITVTSGSTGQNGTISVTAGNSCGTSTANTLAVTVSPATPATPGTIAGSSSVCPGITGLTYSIFAVTNATTYNWTIPTGWSITAGTGTNSITVTSGSTGQNGTISVTAENSCGTSAARTFALTVSPATPSIPGAIAGNITQCPALTSQIYSVAAVTNATIYTWTVPSGWSITAGGGTNSITVTSGSTGQNGNISVTAGNSCGTSAANTLAVTLSPATPATPGVITGTSPVCPGINGLTYSIAAVTDATTYTWTVPTGWAITAGSGTNSITVTSGSAGQNGNISVTAGNSCGTSAAKTLGVTVSPATPATPGAIVGSTEQCISKSGLIYSIAAVPNATSYIWTLPSGWSVTAGTNTNAITVSTSGTAVGGNISVTAVNSCGTSSVQTFAVTTNTAIPAIPGTPTSPQSTSICPVVAGLQYNIPAVTNATSYTWTLPTGWVITAGSSTNSITVTASSSAVSGNISVKANNACGSSASSANLPVTVGNFAFVDAGTDQVVCQALPDVSLLPTTGGATGNNNVFWSSSNGGSFAPNANKWNATYTPGAAAIAAGTVTLTVTSDDPSGSCLPVSDQLVVTIKSTPTATISGTTTLCSGSSAIITFTATPNTMVTYKIGTGANQTISIDGTGIGTVNTGVLATNTTYNLVSVAHSTFPSCSQPASGTAIITINAPAIANANIDQMVCASSPNVTLAGAISGTATSATWSGGAGTFNPNNTTLNAVYTPTAAEITAGTVTLTLTTNDPLGPCPTATDQMVITINPSAVANANIDQIVCASSPNTTLAGAISGAATSATWSGGAGTFSPNNATLNAVYTPAAGEITAGIVTLTLTTNDPAGPCPTASDQMVITINPSAVANANIDQIVCASSPNVTLSGAISGAATSGTWSGGTGTFSPNNTTLNAVYTPSAAEITAGTVTLTLTTNDPAGPCPSASDQMVITINPSAVANANIDQIVCASSPNITLAGAISGTATSATWSGGTGTFNPNNTTLNAVYTPTAGEITAGTVTLTLTTNDPAGPCLTASDQMVITFNPSAVANANIDQIVCASSPNVTLAGAISGTATSATWSGGTGTFNPNNTTLNAVYTPTAGEITVGTVTLTLTTNDPVGPCPTASDLMVITINPSAVANANIDQIVCASSPNVSLAGALSGAATSGTWSGGTGTFSPNNTTLNAVYTPSAAEITAGTVTLALTTNDPAGPCANVSDQMVITINPSAIISAGSNQTICSNTTATMAGSIGGGASSATWSTSGSGTFSNNTPSAIYSPSTNDINSGTVTLNYTTNDPVGPCGAVNATMTLTIKKAVVISNQPSNTSICASLSAALSVIASGDGLTYQWYKGTIGSGVPVVNSANITGATTNVLNFAQAALTDDGPYYAIVSGIAPCADITSNQVTLNVDQSIIITSQPISKTVCEDTPNVSFSVTANAGGDPLTYQWRKNGVNIVGAIGPTFTIPTVTLTTAGNYDVLISGPSGYTCSSIQSAAVTLTINPKPIGSATAQTICSGSSTNVALNSTVSGTTFTWTATILTPPTGGTINGHIDSSGLSITQTLNNTGTSAGTIRYTITPTANSCIGTAFTVDVTVNPAPVGSATAQTICSGSTTSVTLNSNVIGTTYSWIAAIQTIPTGGTITGFSNGSLNTIAQTLSNTGTTFGVIRYTVIPTANSCSGTAFTVDVAVNPNSTIVLSSVSGSDNPTNCVNTVLNISYAIGGGGTNASITAGALPAGVSGSYNSGTRVFTISGTPSSVGTFSYTVTTQGLCSNASLSGTITVNPDSTINLNLGTGSDNQTKCINSLITPIKYTISNGGPNPTITWNPGPANFIGSYDSTAGVYTISGSSAVAGTFNYTISTAGSCINSSLTGSIIVNPNPMGSATGEIICSGSTTNVVLNPSTGGTTFAWTAAIQNGPTGGTISGFGSGSGASIAQALTNSGTTAGSIRYTVTPTANSCPGSPFTVDVTVNPKPTGSATAQTICSGSATNVPLNSSVSGTTYTWTSATISTPTGGTISGFNNGAGNTIVQSLSNNGTTAGVIRYTVTPTATSCSGTAFTVDVTVNAPTVGGTTTISSTSNPSNVGNGTTRLTDCHSSGGVITLNGNVGTVVRWETSTNAGGTWIPKGNAGSLSYTYTGIIATTIFRAVIQNGSCTTAYSEISTLFIIPNIKPSPVSAIPSTICEGESSQLTSSSGFSSSQNLASGGLFNQANPPGWLVDDKIFPASGDNGVNNEFSETNGNAGDEYDSGDGKFAITRGNRTSIMQTPAFDLIGLTSANLTFDQAYKLDDVNDYAEVKISLDGGLTYTTLATFNGNTSTKNPFKNSNPANSISLNLNAYLGYSNIKIGFFFFGTVNAGGTKIPNIGSTWAIDNVKIPQAPDPQLTSQWLNQNTGEIISVSNTTNVTVTPPVTTIYKVTSFLNGCTSYGDEGTTLVTVTVNKRPTANIFPDQTICYDGTATFSVALTGVAPWTVTYSNGSSATTVTGIMTSPYTFTVSNVKANATYTITALNDKNCTPFPGGITGAAKVQVITGRAGWWTGLASTDWFDCKNWEQGLPSFTVDANILPTAANSNRLPVIDKTSPYAGLYGGIASARDMIINNNGSVTVVSTNNSELQISRDWRNSGAFTPGTGTVTFNGATVNQIQNINVIIKNNETFYNLTTNNTGGAKGISVIDGFELTVKNLVTLTSGDLRLTGEAQLVQEGTASNTIGGSGRLLRDQQGQRNSFNYNYWSSPVSSGADATHYSIGGILRDGTDITNVISISNFNQEIIDFGDGVSYADGILSSPIKISNRWIWSYSSLTPAANSSLDNYNLWKYLANTGTLNIGEGFTMKGTGGTAAITDLQNYVFAGKPNSGTISLILNVDQTYLVGNPYPSALDANEFIKDNLKDCIGCRRTDGNAFSGALYFWDHFGLSNNHLLAEYQGGYATYSLMGGVVGIANDPLNVNNGSTGLKIPRQYVPVAQGFFIDGYIDSDITAGNGIPTTVQGGAIIFKNSQRAFMKESTGNSLFMKTSASAKTKDSDTRSKIRLGFDSSIGAHRQLLVGADPNTTNQFDIGYDAPMFDLDEDDMFWEISNSQYVIQGVPNFDDTQIIPLGLIVANEGKINVKIDALENVSSDTEIYLYDNVTGMYHNIRENSFTISLSIGDYSNRFSLRFTNKSLNVDDNALTGGILTYFTNNNKILNIKNNFIDATISTVHLFNILGQSIINWNVADQKQNNIQIPIKNMPAGVYIVKIKTTKGVFNKKILIK